MPNWCYTVYKCTGQKKDLNKLHEVLKSLQKDTVPAVDNGFGNLWLGCIVNKLGGDWEKVYCRGKVIHFSLDDNILTISQETAWCEQREFREFLEFTFPGMKIYYLEEEPGEDIYCTNDKSREFFPERFILDCDNGENDCSYEYYENLETVIRDIENFTGEKYEGLRTVEDVEEYLEEYNSRPENEDNFIYCCLHEFEYTDD